MAIFRREPTPTPRTGGRHAEERLRRAVESTGADHAPAPAARVFRTVEVARVLGLSPKRVRAYVHIGICRPQRRGNAFEFSFQDLVLLRAARGLLGAGVPARSVHRALGKVGARLGSRPLSSLRFGVVGKQIIVSDGQSSWQPEDGQLLFGFRVAEIERAVRKVDTIAPSPPQKQSSLTPRQRDQQANHWFERGLDLEHAGDHEGAARAYRKTLEFEPRHADACVNLGRLLHQEGRLGEAARLYRAALAVDASDAVAHYNLALVLEDQRKPQVALTHYRRAVVLQDDFADAHYNLARLLEELGRHTEAVRHLLTYSALTKSD